MLPTGRCTYTNNCFLLNWEYKKIRAEFSTAVLFTFFVVINYTYLCQSQFNKKNPIILLYISTYYIDGFFFPSRILSCMSICLHYLAKKSHPIPAINPMFTLGSRMFFKVRHLGKKKDEFEANDRLFFRRSPSYNVPILYDFFSLFSSS